EARDMLQTILLASTFFVAQATVDPAQLDRYAAIARERQANLRLLAQPPDGPKVTLSAVATEPSGSFAATSSSSWSGNFDLYLYARGSVCELGGVTTTLPADAGFGWKISVRST